MVLMVPLLIMATSLVSKINTRVALLKGWVNSFLAFMGQLYLGFYSGGWADIEQLPIRINEDNGIRTLLDQGTKTLFTCAELFLHPFAFRDMRLMRDVLVL